MPACPRWPRSLAIAAAMGVLAYATLLARNEAQRQRADAVRAGVTPRA